MQDKLTQVHEPLSAGCAPEGAAKKSSSAGWIWLVVLAVVGAGGYYAWRSTQTDKSQAPALRGAARAGRPETRAAGPFPWWWPRSSARICRMYLDGLGSVSAFYTVTLKSRVDGEMMEVDFKEGQDVKKGDLLAVIDPRPYQVALAQAQANLAKDQAQLADAKLDANRYDQLVKQGVIPQQQYDTQHALAGQLEGAVRGRSGRDRQRETQCGVLAHYLADRRARRAPSGGSGKHRARRRCQWDAGHHADGAHCGYIHHPGG